VYYDTVLCFLPNTSKDIPQLDSLHVFVVCLLKGLSHLIVGES